MRFRDEYRDPALVLLPTRLAERLVDLDFEVGHIEAPAVPEVALMLAIQRVVATEDLHR